ncbi:MAG: chemotaxis protein CheA [Phycisphaerales bacterium]
MSFDPEILQDFLTESGELLEQFDSDLVSLERAPDDEELVNRAFRALHTIKGSASFLSLEEIVRVAHASEEALNAARKGQVRLDRPAMDHLLAAADVIKRQMDQLRRGGAMERAGEDLIAALTALGRGESAASGGGASGDAESAAPAGADALVLPSHKEELLGFMVSDVQESLLRIEGVIERMARAEERRDGAADLAETSQALERSVEFFEQSTMAELASALSLAGERLGEAGDETAVQSLPRLRAAVHVLRDIAEGLGERKIRRWELGGLCASLMDLSLGNGVSGDLKLKAGATYEDALRVDGVSSERGSAAAAPEEKGATVESKPSSAKGAEASGGESKGSGGGGEASTIRVDVQRLESLLDLVGELVLQKNRVASVARKACASASMALELREALTEANEDLDRVTGDLQLAVMRTRMQPLDKVFGRYPRLIRDLERATGKSLRLEIVGGETEVDKTVIELIGDPLVHLLRNSADHGVENPATRREAGKSETGTIRLSAQHAGEHVVIEVSDDGAGLSRDRILKRAVERGLVTQEAGDALPDGEVFKFIFAPGFSTAEVVSDLSGRGVGMDVVNTNIQKMKGSVSLRSEKGNGTTVSIAIPLTLAILDAMIVGVGEEEYAIPLSSVVEIVKPRDEQVETIRGGRVMRLRDTVLPLVDGWDAFGNRAGVERQETPFAVVLSHGGKSAGLLVSRLIGQREIVVKTLDGSLSSGTAVSGVTVGEDGEASLIVDVARLLTGATASGQASRSSVASEESGVSSAPLKRRAA